MIPPTDTTTTTPADGAEVAPLSRHEWTIPLPSRFRETLDKVVVPAAETSPGNKPAAPAEPVASDTAEEPESEDDDELLTDAEEDTEDDAAADEDAEEAEDDPDAEAEEEEPKSRAKMLKRINKLTARAKSAEEELERLRSAPPVAAAPPVGLPPLHGMKPDAVPTLEDLAAVEANARRTRDWAREHRRTGATVDGHEYSAEDVQEILDKAKEDLEEGIPAHRRFIQQRREAEAAAQKAYPQFFGTPEVAARVRAAASVIPGLTGLPDADLLAGAMMVGLQVKEGKYKLVKADPARPAAAAAQPVKPKPRPIGTGSRPPGAGAGQTQLEALRAAAARTRRPEDYARYRAAKRAAGDAA